LLGICWGSWRLTLAGYWENGYDWRRVEQRLNAFPQFLTEIDGLDIHFIHARSKHENALPLILTHGWPGSIVEFLGTIDRLTDPESHGGRAEDAFHVVIPSIPGYGFSGRPETTGWGPEHIAQAWVTLMNRLGYQRFVAQGGDWGGLIVDVMGVQAPDGLMGIPPTSRHRPAQRLEGAGVERTRGRRSQAVGSVRRREPGLRPAQLPFHPGHRVRAGNGVAPADPLRVVRFADRPRGLDARPRQAELRGHLPGVRAEGARRQPHPGRDPRQRDADVADEHGRLVGSALLGEQERILRRQGRPGAGRCQRVPNEIYQAPRSWTEQAYPNLVYFNEVDAGNHFAAWQEPDLFTTEVRNGFRPLR